MSFQDSSVILQAVPAMCRLDYSMSDGGKASEFVREYTANIFLDKRARGGRMNV